MSERALFQSRSASSPEGEQPAALAVPPRVDPPRRFIAGRVDRITVEATGNRDGARVALSFAREGGPTARATFDLIVDDSGARARKIAGDKLTAREAERARELARRELLRRWRDSGDERVERARAQARVR